MLRRLLWGDRDGPEAAGLWLVVGLGNPGRRYEGTYHNAGRRTVEAFVERRGSAGERWQEKYKGFTRRAAAGEAQVLALLPETFMNLSGESAAAAARRLKVPPARIIVAHDDLDLEPGLVRVKLSGGTGGHKGIASCAALLGTGDFPRVRIGIGRDSAWDPADYVLSRIRPEHEGALAEAFVRGAEAIEAVIRDGPAAAMNRYNKKQKTGEKTEDRRQETEE